MSGVQVGILTFVVMLALMFVRVPIGIAMFASGAGAYIYLTGGETGSLLNLLKNLGYARLSNYDLVVIPLFLLMGQFATHGHLRDMTNGGADYAFECVGSQKLLRQAIESTRRGWGTTVAIGIPPDGEEFSLRPRSISEGRSLMGSYLGNIKTRTQLPKLVDWHVEGKISLSGLISHTFDLNDINKGFELMREGKSLRTVVTF